MAFYKSDEMEGVVLKGAPVQLVKSPFVTMSNVVVRDVRLAHRLVKKARR